MKNKQRIDKSEPYFVHIGYTYANELKKTKLYQKGRYKKLKTRNSVQKRIEKLHKYWKMALK